MGMINEHAGKRVRIVNYGEFSGKLGIISKDKNNYGPYAYVVNLDDGDTCVPYIPGNGEYEPQCEWLEDDEPDQMQQYLTDRIQALTEAHNNCKKAEGEAEAGSIQELGNNSLAAGLWESLQEVTKIKELYEKTRS